MRLALFLFALLITKAAVAEPGPAPQTIPSIDASSSAAPVADEDKERARPEPLHEGRPADVRLVVTGGLAGLRQGYDGFWSSALFEGGSGLPLRLSSAEAAVAVTDQGAFFASVDGDAAKRALALAAAAETEGGRALHRAFLGPGAVAVTADGQQLTGDAAGDLGRALAAVPRLAALEQREVTLDDGREVTVYGVDLTPFDPLRWPTPATPLSWVPAARARLKADDGAVPVILHARSIGGTPRTFGTVDELLAQRAVATRYLDVGGALVGGKDASLKTARAMLPLLLERDPVVLGTGRAELIARLLDPSVLRGTPHVLAASGGGPGAPEATSLAEIGGKEVLFVAVGELGARARALVRGGLQPMQADQSITLAGSRAATEDPDLVLGLALSAEGTDAALASSTFDAVFHLVSHRSAALPAVDDLDLTRNHRQGLHAGPALIRVSGSDVTEARFWLSETGRVVRLRIDRHSVTGEGPEAEDALAALVAVEGPAFSDDAGLPARDELAARDGLAWNGEDLSHLRAEMVRRALDVEVAMLPAVSAPLPVEGPIPANLARAWLADEARVPVIWLRGSQLQGAFGAMKKLGLSRFAVAGASVPATTVAKRGIAPLEYYRVALTPLVQQALVGEGVKIEVEDGAVAEARSVASIVDEQLASLKEKGRVDELLAAQGGEAVHAFFLEISNLSINGSLHSIRGNEGLNQLRDARVQTPNNFAVGIDGRASAIYDGPWSETTAFAESQFSHVSKFAADRTRTVTEARDVLLFGVDERLKLVQLLPWDRAATLFPRPTLRVTYQTEWTPNIVIGDDGEETTLPRRSELRGLLGAGVSPQPWLTDLRLGILVENDFATSTAGALEWGGEAALSGKWAYEVFRFSLDGYARVYAPSPGLYTPDDLGLAAQAIARVEVPVIFDLSLSGFVDVYLARGKIPSTRGPVGSVIVGAALSYGQRLKWIPFGR